MPTKYNIEELKNLIHIKLGEHNEVYQKEIERLTELANKTNDNKNDDPYIHLN